MPNKSALWAGLCCALFFAGCITAPCPAGTVMDGQVCKRVNGSAAQDAGATGDDSDQRTDSSTAKGTRSDTSTSKSGGNASMTARADAAAESSKGAAGSSAGSKGAGDTPSNTARDAGSAPPSRSQTAGREASRGGSRAMGTSNTPAAGSGGGVDAGAPRAEDEAGGGAPSTPPTQDAGTPPDAPASDWTCVNVDQSCTCVSGLGASGSCTSKPPCCFTLPSLMSCQCWPEEHENCKTFMDEDPNGKRVPTCPPP
jgi:hypothetical protein